MNGKHDERVCGALFYAFHSFVILDFPIPFPIVRASLER